MLNFTRRTVLIALSLLACRSSDGPADPVWGKQACDSCRMLVSDPVAAAQLVDQRGERRFFDDIGCLDAYLTDHPSVTPRGIWVRSGQHWIDAGSARYASGAKTPMDYGIVPDERGPLDFSAVRSEAARHRSGGPR